MEKQVNLDAEQFATVMNADKQILRSIASTCFRRCVLTYEKEFLNDSELNCVDRCTYKYDSMIKHLVDTNSALKYSE